jgi:nitroimidazol reductase NimA-like FMN-containing flavoprotein (pyridoxamine 5'-phosphate oxidase superfamily)
MRRTDREVTDRRWQEQVLNEAPVLELGMVDQEGKPYVVPIGFGYEDGMIYLHGALEGKKNDALAANPNVCFQVCIPGEAVAKPGGKSFTMEYRSVTGYGRVENLTDLDEKNKALEVLMRHYNFVHAPVDESQKLWVARIAIESMTGKANPPPEGV